MRKKMIIYLVMVLCVINANAQRTIIEGKVVDKYLQTNVNLAKVKLYKLKADINSLSFYERIIKEDSTSTDTLGKYQFIISDTGEYSITINKKLNVEEKTIYLISNADTFYYESVSDWYNINVAKFDKKYFKKTELEIYCPYLITKNLKICPVCLKADKLCSATSGLPIPDRNKIQEIKCNLGCVVKRCMPSKYCTRCNLWF